MRALDRKLVRDVWQQRTQVVTVALVLASAIAGFAGSFGTYYSLVGARADFYAGARFADVFADAKRAPAWLTRELAALPGVARADATVVFDATLDVPGVAEPIVGRLIGLPDDPHDALNRVVLRSGSLPRAQGEAVLSEGFALARHLRPGDRIRALVNGRRTAFTISGIGLAPDYIYASAGGAFPDDRNFAVLWMAREPLARAYDMEGAFNHLALRLAPGASAPAVMAGVDALLEPHGGFKAYDRSEQPSHRILDQEMAQWRVMGTLLPSIFLGVAAFLLNVVQNRQVRTQREQIAALKALGYGNGALARHYLLQALAVLLLGVAFGVPVAWWFGNAVTALYADFFHFPSYRFFIPGWVHALAVGIGGLAVVVGALGAIRRVVALAPAEAMRPPYPGRFRRTLLERLGLGALAGPALRMTLRNLERRPWRAAITVLGIASAMSIIVVGLFARTAQELTERVGAAEARLTAASAAVERAKTAATLAKSELERVRGLSARGFASKQAEERVMREAELRDKDLAVAQNERHAVEHDLAVARAALAHVRHLGAGAGASPFVVRAPGAGRVLRVLQESETVVNVGTPLLEIGDPAALEVVADVLTTDAESIRPGNPVVLERGRGPPLEGRVRVVEPGAFTKVSTLGVEEQRTHVVMDLTSPRDAWTGLGDAYRLDVHIVVEREDAVLTVPTAALFRDGDGWAVFAVAEGRARRRNVEIGGRNRERAVLKRGLAEGDVVILYRAGSVQDGVRVQRSAALTAVNTRPAAPT